MKRLVQWLPIIACVIFLGMLGYIALLLRAGIEWSDEGLYLNLMRHPRLYGTSTSQAGLVYAPWMSALSGNIWLLRLSNITVLTTLFGVLGFFALRPRLQGQGWGLTALSLLVALSSLFYLQLWLPTPNYNVLNLQGLALTLLLALLARSTTSWSVTQILWFFAGSALALSFQAKPTSAGFAALVLIPCALTTSRHKFLALAVSILGTITTLCVFALITAGGLSAYIEGLQASLSLSQALDAGYSLYDMLNITRPNLPIWLILALGAVLMLSVVPRYGSLGAAALAALTITLSALVLLNAFDLDRFHNIHFGALIGLTAIGLMFAVLITQKQGKAGTLEAIDIALLLMPFAYWFGSNNSVWYMSNAATAFWVIAALRSALALRGLCGFGPAFIVSTLTILALSDVLDNAIDQPYRQDISLRDMHSPLNAEPSLRVSQETAAYEKRLQNAFNAANFKTGDPVIDLTGRAPGTLYLIKATPVGAPWLLGGYEGSEAFARLALARFSCTDLTRALVLIEEGGPRALPETVLQSFALSLQDHYTKGTSISAAQGETKLQLYKPNSDASDRVKACKAAKKRL